MPSKIYYGKKRRQKMVTRAVTKDVFVDKLHNWVMQYNAEIGRAAGLTEEQVQAIMESQAVENKKLCGHIYDFLKLEGYVDG